MVDKDQCRLLSGETADAVVKEQALRVNSDAKRERSAVDPRALFSLKLIDRDHLSSTGDVLPETGQVQRRRDAVQGDSDPRARERVRIGQQ